MTTAVDALTVRTVAIDDTGELLGYVEPDGVVWLHDGDGLVAWGEAARISVGSGGDRFARAASAFRALTARARVEDEVGVPGTGVVAFGSFTFDPQATGSTLVVPRVVLGRRDGQSWMTVVGPQAASDPPAAAAPPSPHARVRYGGSSKSELAYLQAVDRAVRQIRANAIDKVVLARDRLVWSRGPFDARLLARRLAARFPSCFTFVCDGLVGATPELLVRRTGDRVASTALAGSAPRARHRGEDERLGQALLGSAKDRVEHRMAVDSVRAVLATRCTELHADTRPWLLRLANIQHLATNLCGRLTPDAGSALELAGALHPTAAVCGTPTDAALAAIRALEAMDRGRYSGPVGWVDAAGNGEWGIALRCAQLDGARARLFAGAGIVAGSLPEAELEETRVKLRAMQSAFEG